MRAGWVWVALLTGCGGDGGSSPPVFEDDDDDVIGAPDPCEGIPTYAVSGMSCAQLGNAFEETMDAADICEEASDCQIIQPPCQTWNQVGCWYVANTACVSASRDQDPATVDLSDFYDEVGGCGTAQPCSCSGDAEADCINGRCELIYTYNY